MFLPNLKTLFVFRLTPQHLDILNLVLTDRIFFEPSLCKLSEHVLEPILSVFFSRVRTHLFNISSELCQREQMLFYKNKIK